MAKTGYVKTVLTGGGASALDGIATSVLLDGDFAFVGVGNLAYFYILDADSGVSSSSPDVIAPADVGGGAQRWILQNYLSNGFVGLSTTSLTVGTGTQTLTIQTNKGFVVGQSVKIAYTTTPTTWMHGTITSYTASTGVLVVSVGLVSGSGTQAAWTVGLAGPVSYLLSPGSLKGLIMTHAVADTDHDITIATGWAKDSTDAEDMVLSSAITKRVDAAWAVGDTNGGMDTGTIPNYATIHVWLIKRSDTGVVDALFSISATAPTMPAGYGYKRLIGSYCTGNAVILNGTWYGTGNHRTFMYKTPVMGYDNVDFITSEAMTLIPRVPSGIVVKAIINLKTFYSDTYTVQYFSSLDSDNLVPTLGSTTPLYNHSSDSGNLTISLERMGKRIEVYTNTAAQFRIRNSIADSGGKIHTVNIGYEMYL